MGGTTEPLQPEIWWPGLGLPRAAQAPWATPSPWLLLVDGVGQPRLQLLAINHDGQILQRKQLKGWEFEPGTSLEFDPSRNQLLLALRPLGSNTSGAGPGNVAKPESGRLAAVPALINGTHLSLKLLAKPIRQAHWLPAK